jgi:nicotinamidase-related amidase
VILKPSYGAFFDTPLETILKRLRVDSVVLAGTLTDCCVGTTARQAYERGFGAVVASDATATSVPEIHEAELQILRRAFARVLTVEQLVGELATVGSISIEEADRAQARARP